MEGSGKRPAGSGPEASVRPRFTGKSAPKAAEMVSMSAPGPSLRFFASTHDSSAETLAPSTIVSDRLMGGMPVQTQRKFMRWHRHHMLLRETIGWQTAGTRGSHCVVDKAALQRKSLKNLTILLAAFIDRVLDLSELIHSGLQALVLWAIELLSAHAGNRMARDQQ